MLWGHACALERTRVQRPVHSHDPGMQARALTASPLHADLCRGSFQRPQAESTFILVQMGALPHKYPPAALGPTVFLVGRIFLSSVPSQVEACGVSVHHSIQGGCPVHPWVGQHQARWWCSVSVTLQACCPCSGSAPRVSLSEWSGELQSQYEHCKASEGLLKLPQL